MNASRTWGLVCVLVGLPAGLAGAVSIETVPVGNPGNAGQLSGAGVGGSGPDRICGAVDYTYNIGTYPVTAGQYTVFLNAVAATDTYALYNINMSDVSQGSGITRSGLSGSYLYSVNAAFIDRPVNFVSWGDAARFANWLHNGRPVGLQDASTTEDGAYDLAATHPYFNPDGSVNDWDGLNAALTAVYRNSNWKWAITSEDEWYKAAYHKNDGVTGSYWCYPTRSNSAPGRDMNDLSGNNANYYGSPFPIDPPYYTTVVGRFQNSDGPYGTFDQGGNVWEWNEAVIADASGPCRGLRGGSFGDYFGVYGLHASMRVAYSPAYESSVVGFRLAEAPGAASCPADFDGDSDVDLADFVLFTACFNGPNRPPADGCAANADLDGDGDADLVDFGILSACFNGPNRPPLCE